MIGKPIPWRDLGYVSLEEFLDQSPDMCRVSYTPTGKVFCQTFCFAYSSFAYTLESAVSHLQPNLNNLNFTQD